MMKCFFVLTTVLLFSISTLLAQPESSLPKLIPIQKGKLWGYCDSTKKMLIPAQFDEPIFFISYQDWKPGTKLAFVSKNNKRGMIDERGKFLIPCEYDILDYRYFPNSLANIIYLQKGKKAWQYRFEDNSFIPITPELNETGEVIDAIVEATAYVPADSNITIMTTGRQHYIIAIKKMVPFTGQLIRIDSIHVTASDIKSIPATDTLFYIQRNNKWGIISANHEIVVQPVYDSIYHVWGGQVFAVQQHKKWGIIHPSKFISAPFIYQGIKNNDTSEGYLVKRNNAWGVLLEDLKTEISIDKKLYDAYEIMRYYKLVGIREKGNKLKGYVDFYGTKYWD